MSGLRKCNRIRVAVVGSGMAGLVTAWLLQNDPSKRYEVKVFESGKDASLDSASVSMVDPSSQETHRIDVPMRAFTEGYYHNLKAMYDYLRIQYRVQPLLFSFARLTSKRSATCETQYFVHASNNHELPPRKPRDCGLLSYLCELVLVVVCYLWFSLACLVIPAKTNATGLCESFEEYLQRIRLPQYFIKYYVLPLLSAVATCSHQALLDFPANDIVEYRRRIMSGRQLVVAEGICEVQQKLLRGLDIVYSAKVAAVEPGPVGIKLRWTNNEIGEVGSEEWFDRVILAVPPNAVASVFEPLRKEMACIPTTTVTTVIHRDERAVPVIAETSIGKPLMCFGSNMAGPELIHLRTNSAPNAATEATHLQACGTMVTSCPLTPVLESTIIKSSTFTRVLRTPKSQEVLKRIFELERKPIIDVKEERWRNGDGGVFLVGSWCWDGMVLLEGCVVSAMRAATALGVNVPWRQP